MTVDKFTVMPGLVPGILPRIRHRRCQSAIRSVSRSPFGS
jgi:hypothetical protein